MKVLMLCNLYYPAIGGNELLNQQVAEQIAKKGHQVKVLAANAVNFLKYNQKYFSSQGLPDKEVKNGVLLERFKINQRLNQFIQKGMIRVRGGYKFRDWILGDAYEIVTHGPLSLGMLPAIRRYRPDILVAINYYPTTLYFAYLARKFWKIPTAVLPLTHHTDPWRHHRMLKKIYANVDHIIASTRFEEEYVNTLCPGTRTSVIGHGIDVSFFEGAEAGRFRKKYGLKDELTVLCVGRKVAGKGIEFLVDAMKLVWEKRKDAQLVLAGRRYPNFDAVLQERIDSLSEDDRKRLFNIDDFDDEEKKDIYAAGDIFVLASRVDSFGMSSLEAWCAGLPIIGCSGTPQESLIAREKTGMLVPYGNAQELSKAILFLLDDNERRKAIGQNGTGQVLGQYTIEGYVDRLLAEFLGIVKRAK